MMWLNNTEMSIPISDEVQLTNTRNLTPILAKYGNVDFKQVITCVI